ncbi:putative lactose permease [Atractiella rhizophila]|nr:putative lactose permease [Atractiella rhizophila]
MSAPGWAAWQNNTDPNWWKDPGLRKNVLALCVCFAGVYSLGYDGVLLTGLQGIASWQSFYGRPTGTTLGLISASYFFPKIMLAPVLCAWVSDRYGRRIPMFIGAALLVAGAFIGCFAKGRGMLIGSRIVLGFGTSWCLINGAPLTTELAHPRYRAKATGYFFAVFYVGAILAGWIVFAMNYWTPSDLNWQWRLPNLLQGFGPILIVLGMPFVDESPRWLVKVGRKDDAHRILAKHHSNGKMDDELVLNELKEIEESIRIEEDAKATSWLSFFDGEGNRRRFLVISIVTLCSQLNGVGIISYYLAPVLRASGITDPAQITGINAGLNTWNLLGAFTGASLSERLGRRRLFLISCTGILLMFSILTGVAGSYAQTGNKATGLAVIPMIYLFYFCYVIAFTPLPPLYVSEICSTQLRIKAMGLLSTFQSVGLAFSTFVNPIALDAIAWKYYLVYIGVQAVFLVLHYIFVCETKGMTVEESSRIYDIPTLGFKFSPTEHVSRLRIDAQTTFVGNGELKDDDNYDARSESFASKDKDAGSFSHEEKA